MDSFIMPDNGSLVRIFHAVQNAPAVDIYINDILTFQNLSYSQFTDYIPITADQYKITVYASNTPGTALLTVSFPVPTDQILTLPISGTVDDLQLVVLNDQDSFSRDNNLSTVRVVALSPNEKSLNILFDNRPFVHDISFREMTPYAQIPARSYTTTITAPENNVKKAFRIELKPEQTSTLYLIDEGEDVTAIQSIDGSSYLN